MNFILGGLLKLFQAAKCYPFFPVTEAATYVSRSTPDTAHFCTTIFALLGKLENSSRCDGRRCFSNRGAYLYDVYVHV